MLDGSTDKLAGGAMSVQGGVGVNSVTVGATTTSVTGAKLDAPFVRLGIGPSTTLATGSVAKTITITNDLVKTELSPTAAAVSALVRLPGTMAGAFVDSIVKRSKGN